LTNPRQCGIIGARREISTATRQMKYKTAKAVAAELSLRGGYLETIRDTEVPEYAPHLSRSETGWACSGSSHNSLTGPISTCLTPARQCGLFYAGEPDA
jgi:hypothetical protein